MGSLSSRSSPFFLDLEFGVLPQYLGTPYYLMRFSSQQPSEEPKLSDSCFAERHQKARGYFSTVFEPRPKLSVKPRLVYLSNKLASTVEQATA